MAVASHGACLALDTTGTTDPQGEGSLTYEFFRYAAGTTSAWVSIEDENESGRHGLAPATLDLLPWDPETAQFRVKVTDPGGAFGIAERSIVLTNGRPVVAREPSRTLPAGGFPWAPGEPFQVPHRVVEYFDPDGDVPTFRWTFSDGTTATGTDVIELLDPGSTGQHERRRSRVIADDGRLPSIPTDSVVTLSTEELWLNPSTSVFSGFHRVDRSHRRFTGYCETGALIRRGAVTRIACAREGGSIVVMDWPPSIGTTEDVINVPGGFNFASFRATPAGDSLWVTLLQIGSPALVQRYALDAAGKPGAVVTTATLPISPGELGAEPDYSDWDVDATVTTDGTFWIVGRGDDQAFSVTPSGTVTPFAAAPNRTFEGLGAASGSTEVWLTELDPVAETARLLKVPEGDRLDLPATFATGVRWTEDATFWVYLDTLGLIRVSAEGLPVSGPLPPESIEAVASDVQQVSSLIVDPLNGDCWAIAGALAHRVDPSGEPFTMERRVSEALFVDPEGALWFTANVPGLTLHSGRHLGDTGLAAAVDAEVAFPDRTTGGLWVVTQAPRELLSVSLDAEVVRRIDRFAVPTGTPIAIPEIVSFRSAPDGRSAWMYVQTGEFVLRLAFLDLQPELPVYREVADPDPIIAGYPVYRFSPVIPSVPGAGSFVWTFGKASDVVTVGTDGTVTSIYTAPGGEINDFDGPARLAQWETTGAVCLATVDAAAVLHVRRIPLPPAAPVELGTMPVPLSSAAFGSLPSRVVGISATVDPDLGEMCWVAFEGRGVDSILAGFQIGGPPDPVRRTRTFGEIDSIAVEGGVVWTILRGDEPLGSPLSTNAVLRFDYNAGDCSYDCYAHDERFPTQSGAFLTPTSVREQDF